MFMCFFPIPNNQLNSPSFRSGLHEFECGSCPECLNKRANRYMVRDVFEASAHKDNCMITLTYDSYIRNSKGEIIGERVSDLKVNKRDVQLFLKRLRSYVFRKFGTRFKYRLSAEYGKRTNRAHYHVLLFGFVFPDCLKYKKSKRGNWIYTSPILTKIWRKGICTVDSKNVSPSVAKYCSKYTSKDKRGAVDTFSLCSHHIGIQVMKEKFNGLYYMVDGKKFPIPKQIWEDYIQNKYDPEYHIFTHKYLRDEDPFFNECFLNLRKKFRKFRDEDPLYKAYLKYWSDYSLLLDNVRLPVQERIRLLDDKIYHSYKIDALEVLRKRSLGIPVCDPRSKHKYYDKWHAYKFAHLPLSSCPTTANDTIPSNNFVSDSKNKIFGVFSKRKIGDFIILHEF